jgi:hypothetical protein
MIFSNYDERREKKQGEKRGAGNQVTRISGNLNMKRIRESSHPIS